MLHKEIKKIRTSNKKMFPLVLGKKDKQGIVLVKTHIVLINHIKGIFNLQIEFSLKMKKMDKLRFSKWLKMRQFSHNYTQINNLPSSI